MEFVLNELAFHGQFAATAEAHAALRGLLAWRSLIHKHGFVLRSSSRLLEQRLTTTATVRDIVNTWKDPSLRGLMITWMSKEGPFWDRDRWHSEDDYFECRGQVVTDHGLAEAALAVSRGQAREMISLSPSDWEETPLKVDWHASDAERTTYELWNVWRDSDLSSRISQHQVSPASWAELHAWAIRTCEHLIFSDDVIEPLSRHPFSKGAAERLQELLLVLNRLKNSFGSDGKFNESGMRLLQDHFVGDKAWFTDSSDSEKSTFGTALTFNHPTEPGVSLFCPWHGKVKIGQLRMHFSYPIRHDEPLYVVYMGPKITKR